MKQGFKRPSTPRNPISKEAHDYLRAKLERMKGIERDKTIKRLEMYDRGYRDAPPKQEVDYTIED